MTRPRIYAGIGCRAGADASAILAAVDAALSAARANRDALAALATAHRKTAEPGLSAASHDLGVPLVGLDPVALAQAVPDTLSHSSASLAATGTPSLSETAALAAAGPGSRLLAPRTVLGPATCALASRGTEAP